MIRCMNIKTESLDSQISYDPALMVEQRFKSTWTNTFAETPTIEAKKPECTQKMGFNFSSVTF
jgi:hypothetical protein